MSTPSADAIDWTACEAVIKRFERAWLAGDRPDVAAYLVADVPWAGVLLVELVHVDLEFRLKAGEAARLEPYLAAFPQLAADRATMLGLIAAEHALRRRHAGHVDPDEYAGRFPGYADALNAGGDTLGPVEDSVATGPAAWPVVPGYVVEEQLGRGGMGVVYKARDVSLGRYVALKFLPDEYARDPDRLERFRREARTASALNHPHICTVHALGEVAPACGATPRPFIVMELIDGPTLRDVADGKTTGLDAEESPIAAACRMVAQAARALAAAHAAGVVHRDVKPENVMVRADGYVKVVDFGLARGVPMLGRLHLPAGAGFQQDTDPGAILGTVAYMSPEQARGQIVESPSDIFSLGIVLYQLVTGRHPFEADSALGILHAIGSARPATPSSVNPSVPPALDGLLEAMLQKDARLRPTAAEVAQTLAGAADWTTAAAPRPLVRRERELALLRLALAAADAGRGSIQCVAGEPGIGKTTLVEDFLDGVDDPDAGRIVGRGHCSERLGATEAYLSVTEALADLVRGASGPAVVRLLRAVAPTWYAQVAPSSAEGSRAPSQPAMLREFVALLRELSRLGTVVLFLDDVHWADVPTVDLLAQVGRHCAGLRVLVVVSYRQTELLLGPHPFAGVRDDLQGRGVCAELRVGFLGRADVERYLNLAFPGHAFGADFARLIHDRTEGSPLFMADLLRYLRERGVLAEVRGRWALARELPDLSRELPEADGRSAWRGLLRRKLDRLTELDRRLLNAAAVQGPEFDSAVVAGALALDPAEVEERLQALERVHGLVRLVREAAFPEHAKRPGEVPTLRYAFVHVLYQQALDAELTPSRRAALGAALGRTLEAHHGANREAAASLAYLYEVGRDYARAARHCLAASDNAARVYAHREAAGLARRGLGLLDALPESPERAALELPLRKMLGLQLQVTQGYAAPEATRAYTRARDLCRDPADAGALFPVLWGLWLAAKVRSELPHARALADELHALAGRLNAPDLTLQSQQALAVTTLCLGEPAATVGHTEEAVRLYDRDRHRDHSYRFGQDPAVACQAFGAVALWLLGKPDSAARLSDAAVRHGRELNHPSTLALALHFAAMVHQLRRDGARTRACAAECDALSAEHGLSFWRAGSAVMTGWALAAAGHADEGIARLRQGLTAWRETGSVTYRSYYLGLLAEVLAARGRVVEAGRVLEEALDLARQTREGLYEAELYRLRGELLPDRAAADFAQALALAARQGARSLELRAARSLARRGDPAGLHRLAEVVATFSEGHDTPDLRDAGA